MLFNAIFISTVLFFITNFMVAALKNQAKLLGAFWFGYIFFAFFLVGSSIEVIALQCWLTVVASIVWKKIEKGRFWIYSGTAFLLSYGVFAWWAIREQVEYARLRDLYPFQSMENRVSPPRFEYQALILSPEQNSQLEGLENKIEDYPVYYSLSIFHEGTVASFIESPGFGVRRKIRPTTEASLKIWFSKKEYIPQPGLHPISFSSLDTTQTSRPTKPVMKEIHFSSFLNFLNPKGYGLFKDRQHVAGFIPHWFENVPPKAESWKVDAIDLMGLLKHDEPIIYLSKNLPNMEELKVAPTRSLDEFEKVGLKKIREGIDYHLADTADSLRMLGAIRALKQCTKCHDAQRGDLLGAFVYTLRKSTE